MFKKVDCLRIPVSDLETALQFYGKNLGLQLVWRRGDLEAGLRFNDSDTELVLVRAGLDEPEIDLLVDSVDEAVIRFQSIGGKLVTEPFDIAVGRCAIVKDPWNNSIVILDLSKGTLKTDDKFNVI